MGNTFKIELKVSGVQIDLRVMAPKGGFDEGAD